MLAWLEQFLVRYPELALFLVIAVGYWIGSFKIGAFSLGPVTGARSSPAYSSGISRMCPSRA
jgi:putative transport protein